MSGCGEAGVAFAAASAARRQVALARLGEVEQSLARRFVPDHRAHRHLHVHRVAFVPGPIAALAVTAALGFMLGVEAEVQQRILVLVGDQVDVAAAAAIAAARPSARDELLPPERQAAIAAVARLHVDSDFVDEHRKAAGLRVQTGGDVQKPVRPLTRLRSR